MIDSLVDISHIDEAGKVVFYDDGTSISFDEFIKKYTYFFKNRIAGETLVPTDMEWFMKRTSGKNLEQLMKGKKYEGFLEGSQGKMLTPGMKIAIGTIATLAIVGVIVLVVLNQQGMIPSFS